MNHPHPDSDLSHVQSFLSGEAHDMEGSITFNVIDDGISPHGDFEDSLYEDHTSYYGGSPVLESPSSPFQGGFPLGLDESSFSPDIISSHYGPLSPHDHGDLDSSNFLLPGPRLQRRRSSSVESFQSLSSYYSTSSAGSYETPSSGFSTSMENLGVFASLGISEPKDGGLHMTHSAPDLPSYGMSYDSRGESSSSSTHHLHMPDPTPSLASHELSTKDMLQLLADAGISTNSKDPEKIRKAFLQKLHLSAEERKRNHSAKPAKMDIGTSATLAAAQLRRKVAPRFFCLICSAGFTRKNGLLNHYRSHLGIADKQCKYCRRNFTTSLSRHEKKCRSNPHRD